LPSTNLRLLYFTYVILYHIELVEVSAKTLFEQLESNPVKAELDYLDKCIVLTGYFEHVIYDTTFTMCSDISIWNDESILCDVVVNEYTDIILEENENKEVRVWGQVTGIDSKENTYNITVVKAELLPEPDVSDIDYIEVTTDEFIEAYHIDAFGAQEKFLGKYVVFSGEIDSIGQDKFRIYNPCISTIYGGFVDCFYTSDEIKVLVAEKNEGDVVTVWGKVTNLQHAICTQYQVDILNVQ